MNSCDSETTFVCIDCIKDSKLRKFFTSENTEKAECTFCKERHHNCLDIKNNKTFLNLVRALIRYHYFEVHYNRYFRENGVSELLSTDNEIFNAKRVVNKSDLNILSSIIEDFSLDKKVDIALYFGLENGTRWAFMERIKDYKDKKIEKLEKELSEKNYFLREKNFLNDLKVYEEYFSDKINKNKEFYRAREGYEKVYKVDKIMFDPSKDTLIQYIPHKASKIGAPPIEKALEPGRLNRTGVSYLYLATDIKTALTEVRPDPGHKVSIGCFKAIRELKIADLDQAFIGMAKNEDTIIMYRYLNHIDQLLSRAITKDERHKYLITQFFSDGFRKLGFDGIMYSSSITTGQNLLIFNPSDFEYIEKDSAVYETQSLIYQHKKLESDANSRLYDEMHKEDAEEMK